MLISPNKFDKSKSKYKCDRCNIDIGSVNRYAIFVAEGLGSPHKRWDLCGRCYRAFYKAIERGIKK